jgi:hypothetical protein
MINTKIAKVFIIETISLTSAPSVYSASLIAKALKPKSSTAEIVSSKFLTSSTNIEL